MSAEKNNRWKDRCVKGYPPPVYCRLTKAMAAAHGTSESKIVSEAVKQYFDRMPDQDKQRILAQGKNHY